MAHAAGEVASRVAVAALEETLRLSLQRQGRTTDCQAALTHAFQVAHTAVCARAEGLSEEGNMGTTLTAALVVGGRLWVGHVGDSRAYLLRHQQAEQLTEDHAIPPNRLTQALGMGADELAPDVFSASFRKATSWC